MSMDRNAVDDARAEDEAFAQAEREQGKERLAAVEGGQRTYLGAP